MLISIIFLIFSYLFQAFISNYISYTLASPSIFYTIYILIAFSIIYPYFNNDKKYLLLIIIFGLLFDFTYTNSLFLTVFIFLISYFIIKRLNYIMPNNLISINIISLVVVMMYHILNFIILKIMSFSDYSFILLLRAMYSSIIITIIYTTISYFIFKKINEKNEIRIK